jgi:YHS domain-containing protein
MAKDFVCGMELSEKTARYMTEFEGKVYYFCSHRCMCMFKEDPRRYIK